MALRTFYFWSQPSLPPREEANKKMFAYEGEVILQIEEKKPHPFI
jgi:hypothetical protein